MEKRGIYPNEKLKEFSREVVSGMSHEDEYELDEEWLGKHSIKGNVQHGLKKV